MRIIKQRLLEMIPDLSVFLDVDGQQQAAHEEPSTLCARHTNAPVALCYADLEEIGDLEGYIERTSVILICTLTEMGPSCAW